MSRVTQKARCLQLLMEKPDKFFPVWWFIGERLSTELGWVFLSHRAPARLTELFQEGFATRVLTKGRTGARYYSYRYKSDTV